MDGTILSVERQTDRYRRHEHILLSRQVGVPGVVFLNKATTTKAVVE